jgi:hypothetical protein
MHGPACTFRANLTRSSRQHDVGLRAGRGTRRRKGRAVTFLQESFIREVSIQSRAACGAMLHRPRLGADQLPGWHAAVRGLHGGLPQGGRDAA